MAHRGGAGLFPENTVAAFHDAVMRGCDGGELDVQLSRDGEVVVYHDYRLKPEITRDANGHWLTKPTPLIKDLSLEELRSFDVGRPDPASKYAKAHAEVCAVDGARIPLLAEIIETVRVRPFRLFIELKTSFTEREISASPEALAEATLAVVRDMNFLDRTVLVGFDWPGLLHAKKIAPGVECWFTTLDQTWFGEGVPPPDRDPPSAPALMALRHWAKTGTSPWAGGFDAVNHGGSILKAIRAAGGDGWFPFFKDASPEMMADAHELGLKVGAWTVDDVSDMRALIAGGIDAICTDRPDRLMEISG